VLVRHRLVARAPVELAETKVTVGSEWAYPELAGPGEGLAVVRVGGLQVGLVGLRGDLAEEAEAISNLGLRGSEWVKTRG
jgi:hypothetical protein